jgi:hypothetical protein
MNAGFLLALYFLFTLMVVGVYELYSLFFVDGNETVSHYLVEWSRQFLILPLAIGIILGHLLFPTKIVVERVSQNGGT